MGQKSPDSKARWVNAKPRAQKSEVLPHFSPSLRRRQNSASDRRTVCLVGHFILFARSLGFPWTREIRRISKLG